jgi:membrane associated rhomboid family serine protease
MTRSPNVTLAIIAINAVVFIAWYTLPLQTMVEHFLVSRAHLAAGHYWVLITSVFSHNMLLHIMINMFVLWSFGGVLEQLLGPGGSCAST